VQQATPAGKFAQRRRNLAVFQNASPYTLFFPPPYGYEVPWFQEPQSGCEPIAPPVNSVL
jgi:hypothetical protein